MVKTFSSSYSPSQITYVEAEAVGFSRFCFHTERTTSTASTSSFHFRFHIPDMVDAFFARTQTSFDIGETV